MAAKEIVVADHATGGFVLIQAADLDCVSSRNLGLPVSRAP